MGPEDNPADDVQPTKEEWEAYERERPKSSPVPMKYTTDDAVYPTVVWIGGRCIRLVTRYGRTFLSVEVGALNEQA